MQAPCYESCVHEEGNGVVEGMMGSPSGRTESSSATTNSPLCLKLCGQRPGSTYSLQQILPSYDMLNCVRFEATGTVDCILTKYRRCGKSDKAFRKFIKATYYLEMATTSTPVVKDTERPNDAPKQDGATFLFMRILSIYYVSPFYLFCVSFLFMCLS
jgi:hypothetical protein